MIRNALFVFLGVIFFRCERESNPSPCKITATAGENGTIDPMGVFFLKSGESKTFSIVPDSGYSILSVIVDGIDQPVSDKFQFTNVSSDMTIEVEFISDNVILLTKGYWYFMSYQYYERSGILLSTYESTEYLTQKYYFCLDGKYKILNEQGGVLENGNWSLKGKTFFKGKSDFTLTDYGLVMLTDKVFSYSSYPFPDRSTGPPYKIIYIQYNFGRP